MREWLTWLRTETSICFNQKSNCTLSIFPSQQLCHRAAPNLRKLPGEYFRNTYYSNWLNTFHKQETSNSKQALKIKPFLAISIYRTQVVFLVDKSANASWDLTTWRHGSSTTTISKKSDAGTFSHHFLHNRSMVKAQGKRKEVAWTLRVGMSEVLTLLPLGSAAGEWAKTFKKFLPYMYQFQESRGWRVIKRYLLTEQQYLVSGRNPFSIAHLGWWWAADHSSASDHLGTGLHSSYPRYQDRAMQHLRPPSFVSVGAKHLPKGPSIASGCAYLPVCLLSIAGHQGNCHPASVKCQKLNGVNAHIKVFSPSATQ